MRLLIPALLVVLALGGCTQDEDRIDDVTLAAVPDTAAEGEVVQVCWDVDGSGEVPHVALHWDTQSHPGADAKFSDYGQLAWPGGEKQDSYDLPGEFCASFTMPDSDVYLRGHAMIDAPGHVSEEGSIQIAAS